MENNNNSIKDEIDELQTRLQETDVDSRRASINRQDASNAALDEPNQQLKEILDGQISPSDGSAEAGDNDDAASRSGKPLIEYPAHATGEQGDDEEWNPHAYVINEEEKSQSPLSAYTVNGRRVDDDTNERAENNSPDRWPTEGETNDIWGSTGKSEKSSSPSEESSPTRKRWSPWDICIGCWRLIIDDTWKIQLQCNHGLICADCLRGWFRSTVTDESSFPPQCCGKVIPLDVVRPFATEEDIRDFQQAEVEYNVPYAHRTYCSNKDCRKFVPQIHIDSNNLATCPHCGSVTCSECKTASHEGKACRENSRQSTLELAKEANCQICPKCRYPAWLETLHDCSRVV